VKTSSEDALRARLARLDPMPSSIPVDPSTSPRAQERLEHIMLTTEQTQDATDAPRWRRPALFTAAATAVVAVGVGIVVANTGGAKVVRPHHTASVLALKVAGSSGPTMHSCVPFTVDVLKGMPVAFGGTVTELSAASVSLTVDRWFKGGTADVVTVALPPGNTSIPDVAFIKGSRFLVTATDGTVNSCGFSAEATPALEKSFEQAFTP
jgi:hypothetical protein